MRELGVRDADQLVEEIEKKRARNDALRATKIKEAEAYWNGYCDAMFELENMLITRYHTEYKAPPDNYVGEAPVESVCPFDG